jgi:lysophospholipid acyltransferase (LPLAT)-like uncharacterized protein
VDQSSDNNEFIHALHSRPSRQRWLLMMWHSTHPLMIFLFLKKIAG